MPKEIVNEVVFEVVKAINAISFENTLASTIAKHKFEGYEVDYEYKPLLSSKDQIIHVALVRAYLD